VTGPQRAATHHRAGLDDKITAELWQVIQPEFASLMSWQPAAGVLRFPRSHPLLGVRVCAVVGCEEMRSKTTGLCPTCDARWQQADQPPLEKFIAVPRVYLRSNESGPCSVPECALPWKGWKSKLCNSHYLQQRQTIRLPLEQFVRHPDVVPLPGYGPCPVVACSRDREGAGTYCGRHRDRWRRYRTQHPDADELRWRHTEPAAVERDQVSLRGLAPRLVAEVIYALQERTRQGIQTRSHHLRPVCTAALACHAGSLQAIPVAELASVPAGLHKSMVTLARRQQLNPDTERVKDEWDVTAFGHSGTLKFTELSQPWLREATKRWAHDDLPRRRGTDVTRVVQTQINSLVLLSDSLRLQRDDHGDRLTALSRTDITAFCNRMAYLQQQDVLSGYKRIYTCRDVRRILTRMRGMGLTRAGQPLHRLPDDFALGQQDIPDTPDDAEAGRDLPAEVMRHLCGHLARLEDTSVELRVAVELLIDTGRRPNEICQLGVDCLERDGDGKPVLVYDNLKGNRHKRRLPIPEATAALVATQQDRVTARFPDAPRDQLKLLPAPTRNPLGTKGITKGWVSGRHRRWVDSLPPLLVPVPVIEDGQQKTTQLPFDPARIYLYAYRHTYAQRHADAGVAVDVLRELMGHRQIGTSQQYYRVGEQRRRDAVERVTTMQFDRHGNRIWRQAKALLDSERVRRAVGEVAVPYGSCSEPSNVAAGGDDCPVRFRCVGCAHFSTDISYLPDLETYLADLLRNRERLLATVEVDDWAKAEAMPTDAEIGRVRRLIARVKADLDGLTDTERFQIDEAITIVRRNRSTVVALGMPRARQPLPDVRPERTA
jgi:integrase